MADRPAGRNVICPECGSAAVAIVPSNATIIDKEDDADGKVWTNCRECDARFLVFYQLD